MLKLLVQDLIDSGPDVEFQARMVLARMESCGMLPPPDDCDSVTGNIVYAYYNERVEADPNIEAPYYSPPIYRKLWEPEDEEASE